MTSAQLKAKQTQRIDQLKFLQGLIVYESHECRDVIDDVVKTLQSIETPENADLLASLYQGLAYVKERL